VEGGWREWPLIDELHESPWLTPLFLHASLLQGAPFAMKPAAAADFRPESIEYYTGAALPLVWPALVGLGIALLLLSFFVIWCDSSRPIWAEPSSTSAWAPSTVGRQPGADARRPCGLPLPYVQALRSLLLLL
jgi:hypothetical protein